MYNSFCNLFAKYRNSTKDVASRKKALEGLKSIAVALICLATSPEFVVWNNNLYSYSNYFSRIVYYSNIRVLKASSVICKEFFPCFSKGGLKPMAIAVD